MRPVTKLAAVTALTLAAAASIGGAAHSGIASYWGKFFVADLRLASVAPSSANNKSARVIVTNDGYGWSKACWVRVTVEKPTPITKHYYLQAMPPKSGIGFDLYMGVGLNSGPGLSTVATVDAYGQVAELNEGNNQFWYLAPVW